MVRLACGVRKTVANTFHRTQEVNPSLQDEASVKQTVAVGCSLTRAALGKSIVYVALKSIADSSMQERLCCKLSIVPNNI